MGHYKEAENMSNWGWTLTCMGLMFISEQLHYQPQVAAPKSLHSSFQRPLKRENAAF